MVNLLRKSRPKRNKQRRRNNQGEKEDTKRSDNQSASTNGGSTIRNIKRKIQMIEKGQDVVLRIEKTRKIKSAASTEERKKETDVIKKTTQALGILKTVQKISN